MRHVLRQLGPIWIVAALGISVAACVLTIQPVIPESESVFEPALLGTWVALGDGEVAVIRRMGETGYLIDYTDDQGETGRFSGRVGWIGDHRILEVEPSIASDDAGSVFGDLLLRGRLIFVVFVEDDELHTRGWNRDRLRDHLRDGETWVPYLAGVEPASGKDEHLVLTGTSTELRTWLRGYLDRTDALGGETVWRKVASDGGLPG